MFWTDIRVGDTVVLDDGKIKLTFAKRKAGDKFRFGIEADKEVSISVESKPNPKKQGLTYKQT